MASPFIRMYKAYIKRAVVYYKYVPPYRAGYYKLKSIGNLNKTIKYIIFFSYFFFSIPTRNQRSITNQSRRQGETQKYRGVN